MKGSEIRARLHDGRRVYGSAIISPSPWWPNNLAKVGLDFVFLDTEHIAIDRAELSWMCRCYDGADLAPIVRIRSPDVYDATRVLDDGARGVIVPYVEHPEQIAAVAVAARHRPLRGDALDEIRAGWREGYASMFIDLARVMRSPRPVSDHEPLAVPQDDDDDFRPGSLFPTAPDHGSPVRRRLLQFLGRQTGQRFGDDLDRWRAWVWSRPYEPHPDYATLKRTVYGAIDPRMQAFFPDRVKSDIRLDRIDWGGVMVNGIPPLDAPKVVAASAASYLKDSNIVFGLFVNGEARAYPKRILAWHEMALDRVGGVDLTIVYCTLCGTVIPFESRAAGRQFRFGTSGLLYESNKLMFDEDTRSLWSAFEGKPVVGSLVGSGVSLRMRPVVTTTWGAWRAEHPASSVLSIDTGHQRDYREGAAYRDYFATDRLMFQVSRSDRRLRNKDEVLVMRLPAGGDRVIPVAIDVRLLRSHPVYSFSAGQSRYVVVTTVSGANRVYRLDTPVPEQPAGPRLVDAEGRRWRVTEDALIPEAPGPGRAPRVPAQRAFWFGWFAQVPDTMLFK